MQAHKRLAPTIWAPVLLFVAFFVTALVYWPGLRSGFLLDDLPNLLDLENIDGTLASMLAYATSGQSGPFGRPLALMTFALQAGAWPNDPVAFKLVNLGLHLLNAGLLYLLTARLATACPVRQPVIVALIVAAIWLALPINVGVVLYTVQRMTLLATTFSLAGLLAYAHIRSRAAMADSAGHAIAALLLLAIGTLLAALSKETGLLTLPLAILCEWLLNSGAVAGRNWRRIVWSSMATGIALAVAGLAIAFRKLVLDAYSGRDFTLMERIATEPGVIVDYVGKIAWPNPYVLGIFQDAYPIAPSPQEIILPLLALAGLISIAIVMVRRQRLVTFGIAWFFIGHALESTIFALELYFEHRNYLPAMGLVIAAVALLDWLFRNRTERQQRVIGALLFALAFGAYLLAASRVATLWAKPLDQAYIWAVAQPESPRARLYLLATALDHRRVDLAERVLADTRRDFPLLPHAEIYIIKSHCESDQFKLPDQDAVVDKILHTNRFTGTYGAFNDVVMRLEDDKCDKLDRQYLETLLLKWATAETHPARLRRALMLLARVQYLRGDLRSAMIHLNYAAEIDDFGSIRLAQARWLSAAGLVDDAERYLDMALENFKRSGYMVPDDSVRRLRQRIDAARKGDQTDIED